MRNNFTFIIKLSVPLVAAYASSTNCQRLATSTQSNAHSEYIKNAPLLVVKGALFKGYDTLNTVHNCSIICSRKLPNGKVESVFDTTTMPATGHYRVRLQANQLYQIVLVHGNRNIETREFLTPAIAKDSTLIHNLYLGYE